MRWHFHCIELKRSGTPSKNTSGRKGEAALIQWLPLEPVSLGEPVKGDPGAEKPALGLINKHLVSAY